MKKLGSHLAKNGDLYSHLGLLAVMTAVMLVAMWPLLKFGYQLEDEGVGKTPPKYII